MQLLGAWSGCYFHFNSRYSTLLFQDAPANTLLTLHLSKFQNMHPYRIAFGTDITAHVRTRTTYPALTGPLAVPETYLFSKELVAYLETLIAFCCYYRADDSRMAGKMEQFYSQLVVRVTCTRPLQRLKVSRLAQVHCQEDDRLVQGVSV